MYVYCRSVFTEDPFHAPLTFLESLYTLLGKSINLTSYQLFIPAYDYQPFKRHFFDPSHNQTNFGLARFIIDNIDSSHYDLLIDPVFTYIIYPGSGNRINEFDTSFMPFSNEKLFLNASDYLVFSPDAFQPSHLMEIEYRHFRRNIPYRFYKEFTFQNHFQDTVQFFYNVRPLEDKYCTYDLPRLRQLLIDDKVLVQSPLFFQYCNIDALFEYLSDLLDINPFFLLTQESQSNILTVTANSCALPRSFFFEN